MSRFWNQTTKGLSPYVAGEQPSADRRVIKLNTNENPYPPTPRVREYLREVDPTILRKYPDPSSTKLREAIAKFYDVAPDQVFCGNGSDEVLALAFRAFFETGADAPPLSVCDVTYSFYPVYAKLYDIPLRIIPLKPDYTVDVEAFLERSGGVVLANPNAPTGMATPAAELIRIIESDPDRVVLIDEAYVGFGTDTLAKLIEKYDNLLVVGTVSKSRSLAGLRVGYAIGSRQLVDGLCRVRDSFNSYPVDSLAAAIALFSFEDKKWYDETRARIVKTREEAVATLRDMGFRVLDSSTNFVFAEPPDGACSAATLYQKLKERDILVRYFSKPRIEGFLRISVGDDCEMRALTAAIGEILAEEGVKK